MNVNKNLQSQPAVAFSIIETHSKRFNCFIDKFIKEMWYTRNKGIINHFYPGYKKNHTSISTNIKFTFFLDILSFRHLCVCNGFVITWILHQNIMYSNKVKLVAG